MLKWISALVIAVSFMIAWKTHDKIYPANDEGAYFMVSQEIFSAVKETGIFEGLKTAYGHRHWKPILHPVFGALFLGLTDGDVRTAVTLYVVFLYTLMLSFAYLYLRRKTNWIGAVAGVNVIAFLPWLFGSSTNFTSEIGFLTATLGFLYVSENLDNVKSYFWSAVLLTLMFCFRPVETALIFSVPILYVVFKSYLSAEINKLDIALLTGWIILFLTVILTPFILNFRKEWSADALTVIFLTSAAYACLCYFLLRRNNLNRKFHIFFGFFFFVSTVWFAPGAFTLFDWILLANFQTMAINTGNRFGQPVSAFVIFYLKKLGLTPWILLGACMLNFKLNWIRLKRPETIVFILGSLLLPLGAGSLSYNGDVRYYYAGWLVAIMVLLRFVLENDGRWLKSRILVVSAVAATLLFHLTNVQIPFSPVLAYENYVVGGSFYITKFSPIERKKELFEQLNKLTDPAKVSTRVFLLVKPQFSFGVDPMSLQVIANEQNKFWLVHTREYYYPDSREENLEELQYYDYVLTGPGVADWTLERSPMEKIANEFNSACSGGTLPADVAYFKEAGKASIEWESQTFTYCLYLNTIKKNSLVKTFH